MQQKPIKVLVVDDSLLVRQILTKGLSMDKDIEVVGSAEDPYAARDKIVKLKPDVLTLDVEMPKMTGVEFLKKLMPQYPIPVVMVSSLTDRGGAITMEALQSGAIDFVTKPQANLAQGLGELMDELRVKVKMAALVDVSKYKKIVSLSAVSSPIAYSGAQTKYKLIAMGASTGGTEALAYILERLPSNLPGIVIVQHMPPKFTKMFAERVDSKSELKIKEAENNDEIISGTVLIAPGGKQMEVLQVSGKLLVKVFDGPLMSGHKPSVDVLFNSVSKIIGQNSIGIILTGMGKDGAEGLKAMHDKGAKTLGQDEASSIVYGMPKVAADIGAVDTQSSLDKIPQLLIESLKR